MARLLPTTAFARHASAENKNHGNSRNRGSYHQPWLNRGNFIAVKLPRTALITKDSPDYRGQPCKIAHHQMSTLKNTVTQLEREKRDRGRRDVLHTMHGPVPTQLFLLFYGTILTVSTHPVSVPGTLHVALGRVVLLTRMQHERHWLTNTISAMAQNTPPPCNSPSTTTNIAKICFSRQVSLSLPLWCSACFFFKQRRWCRKYLCRSGCPRRSWRPTPGSLSPISVPLPR